MTTHQRNSNTGVPSIPLHALGAIKDENIRVVLQAIVDGWNVRNGHASKGDNRFITAAEVEKIRGSLAASLSGKLGQTGVGSGDGGLGAGKISQIINDLQASIMESQLWIELGERIKLIDLNIIKEQQQRIREVQQMAEDLLEFEGVTGSKIAKVEQTTKDQAIVVSGLATRVNGAESTIISLGQTTANQAQTLNSLTTRVNGAESTIISLGQTTANQAQTLNSLTTRVNGAETNISTLNTTTANQANSLNNISAKVGTVESALTSEQTARANGDNALSSKIDTQMTQVNQNIAAIQTKIETSSNATSALSTKVESLNTTVNGMSTAIQTEATARQTADNDMYAKYSVKIDQNGYVSGYGLMSTANNATPTSEFIVLADRFAIGSPNNWANGSAGNNVQPKLPFIVRTSPETIGNKTYPAGVYIDTGMIHRLQVDRLELMALGGYFSIVNFVDGVCSGTVYHNSGRAVLPYAAMTTASYYPITGWVVTSAGPISFNYILYAFNGKGEGLTGPMAVSWGYL